MFVGDGVRRIMADARSSAHELSVCGRCRDARACYESLQHTSILVLLVSDVAVVRPTIQYENCEYNRILLLLYGRKPDY